MLPQGSVQLRHGQVKSPRAGLVLGVRLALTDYYETLDWIEAMVDRRERGYVCVCNVHTVMAAAEDPELRRALVGSSLNVPDGQPLVWALKSLGHPLESRVYGPELMARACARAGRAPSSGNALRFYLYGGRDDGALAALMVNLHLRYPGVSIVGGYSPPHRPLTADEAASVIEDINGSDADVVWVGIGVPKQEKWMADMRPQLEAPVLVGVGAAFDFHAGLVPQAPSWMQESGLEWAYRLAREPRRLWRRYLRYNPRFVAAFARQLATDRRSARSLRRAMKAGR